MTLENKIRILLVDDEEKFLKTVSERLSIKGFKVTTAINSDNAIKAAKEDKFDVAILDLQMPGTSGAELLKLLKENHKFIEIIMLTGHASLDSAVECTKLGAFGYLEKPYDFDRLLETLKGAYEARLKKKYEHNQKRMKEIQKLSLKSSSPLSFLDALAKLDDGEK
ncbi:response regulator receiver protein [Candidatus Magnetomorum sp. HK-1]|nr:response regulator receiver protein [Candidatus Magnetomorum sp. HK-1]